jgi:hypothetical protein
LPCFALELNFAKPYFNLSSPGEVIPGSVVIECRDQNQLDLTIIYIVQTIIIEAIYDTVNSCVKYGQLTSNRGNIGFMIN